MTPLDHSAHGRSIRAATILWLVWMGIGLLWLLLDATDWIVAVLLATTLPAVWDFAVGRRAWMRLDDTWLRWGSGRAEGEIALASIDHVRLETRLDMSVRVRVVVQGGQRITLPQDALPPHRILEEALKARKIAVRRHHFGLL